MTVLIFIGIGFFATNISKYIGSIKTILLPSMNSSDIASVSSSFKDQQLQIINFEKQLCTSFEECVLATHSTNSDLIEKTCANTQRVLAKLSIPSNLPKSVTANLRLYHKSILNSTQMTIDSWHITSKGRSGGSFWTYLKNWEIDTCSYESVPQKIYRLYKLDKLTNQQIVKCEDFKILSESLRTAASVK